MLKHIGVERRTGDGGLDSSCARAGRDGWRRGSPGACLPFLAPTFYIVGLRPGECMSLSLADRQAILALLHQEVVPALGCTEPIAVALTAARAAEALGRKPERLDVAVSAR